MTQKEFEDRVKRKTAPDEYRDIETLYHASRNTHKDQFCADLMPALNYIGSWATLPVSLKEIAKQVRLLDEENNGMKSALCQRNGDLADILIGKAHAYEDTDLRNEAVKLVGETDVVKRTIEMGLPLWDEDRKHILSMINGQGKLILG